MAQQSMTAPPVLDSQSIEGFWRWSLVGLLVLCALSFFFFLIAFFAPQLKPTAAALFAHLPGRKKSNKGEEVPAAPEAPVEKPKEDSESSSPEEMESTGDELANEEAALAAAIADLPPPPEREEEEPAEENLTTSELPSAFEGKTEELQTESLTEESEKPESVEAADTQKAAEATSAAEPEAPPADVEEEVAEEVVEEEFIEPDTPVADLPEESAPKEEKTEAVAAEKAPVEEEVSTLEESVEEETIDPIEDGSKNPKEVAASSDSDDFDLDDIAGDIEKAMSEPPKEEKTEILVKEEALSLPDDLESDETELGGGETEETPIFDPSVLDEALDSDEETEEKK